MLRINFGHCVQAGARGIRIAAFRQGDAFKGHAFLDLRREQRPGLQKEQLVIKVAKGILWFQVQRQRGTGAMALQGFFDARQQVVAAHQKFDGIIKDIQFFAQGVLQRPGQCDHTLLGNFHRRIVAV